MIRPTFIFMLLSSMSTGLFGMEPLLKEAKIEGLCSVHSGVMLPRVPKNKLQAKANMQIEGIHTTDKFKVMILKTVVDESEVLKQCTREYKQSGFLAGVLLTRDEFSSLTFYLRLGMLTHDQLLATLDGYTKKEWRKCRKVATQYRINKLRSAVLEMGVKKGWMMPQKAKTEVSQPTNPPLIQ